MLSLINLAGEFTENKETMFSLTGSALEILGLEGEATILFTKEQQQCLSAYIYGFLSGLTESIVSDLPALAARSPEFARRLMNSPAEVLGAVIESSAKLKDDFVKGLKEVIIFDFGINEAMKMGKSIGQAVGAIITTKIFMKALGVAGRVPIVKEASQVVGKTFRASRCGRFVSAMGFKVSNSRLMKFIKRIDKNWLQEDVEKLTARGYNKLKSRVNSIINKGKAKNVFSGRRVLGANKAVKTADGGRGLSKGNKKISQDSSGARPTAIRSAGVNERAGEGKGLRDEAIIRKDVVSNKTGRGFRQKDVVSNKTGRGFRQKVGETRQGIGETRQGIGETRQGIGEFRNPVLPMAKTFKKLYGFYNKSDGAFGRTKKGKAGASARAGEISQGGQAIEYRAGVYSGRMADVGVAVLKIFSTRVEIAAGIMVTAAIVKGAGYALGRGVDFLEQKKEEFFK